MLLHVRPRLFSPFRNVTLIDLKFSFGLSLTGGLDIATHRPYPNKCYAVACRKKGHKAIDGILIETESICDEFHYTARWAVEASLCVTHRVDYRLLDHEFDAASDDMTLWHASSLDFGGWTSRFPDHAQGNPPLDAEPMMEVVSPRRPRRSEDLTDKRGFIVSRRQFFQMPTIERGRITDSQLKARLPSADLAFRHP